MSKHEWVVRSTGDKNPRTDPLSTNHLLFWPSCLAASFFCLFFFPGCILNMHFGLCSLPIKKCHIPRIKSVDAKCSDTRNGKRHGKRTKMLNERIWRKKGKEKGNKNTQTIKSRRYRAKWTATVKEKVMIPQAPRRGTLSATGVTTEKY